MVLWSSLVLLLSASPGTDPVELDRGRITEHLRATEEDLRTRDIATLSPSLRRARERNLDALHRYWVRAVYPVNTITSGVRTPVFIDGEGRACAVGQLMIDSGASVLAERIADDERIEYLATIETEGVDAWIAGSGLTFAELARIQPAYCGCGSEPLEPVCGVDGQTYPNRCIVEDCSGVEVDHEGPCEGNSESGNGETDGATTGEAGSSTGSTGSTTSEEETSSSSSSSSSSSGTTTTDVGGSSSGVDVREQDPSGCRLGGGDGWWCLGLLALGWRRRQ